MNPTWEEPLLYRCTWTCLEQNILARKHKYVFKLYRFPFFETFYYINIWFKELNQMLMSYYHLSWIHTWHTIWTTKKTNQEMYNYQFDFKCYKSCRQYIIFLWESMNRFWVSILYNPISLFLAIPGLEKYWSLVRYPKQNLVRRHFDSRKNVPFLTFI